MDHKNNRTDVLFLPFLKIASGHHHAADAIIQHLPNEINRSACLKVEILSYSYGKIERIVSSTYLTWIRWLPDVYNRLYYKMAYQTRRNKNRNYLYETLFITFFRRLLKDIQPRLIFCTHALPSYVISVLKQKKEIDAITVNVYTDFFINRLWGIEGIDYHFVSSVKMKNDLIERGVKESKIFITGIPIDPVFIPENYIFNKQHKKINILVSGGNLGVGSMKQLLPLFKHPSIHYNVLCGKNNVLYENIKRENNPNITPFFYITKREKMNDLYNLVDGVLTKPGGVTMSECLIKRKPIFMLPPLPGQETINVKKLTDLGVVIPVKIKKGLFEQQIIDFFKNRKQQTQYFKQIDSYHEQLEPRPMTMIIKEILKDHLKYKPSTLQTKR